MELKSYGHVQKPMQKFANNEDLKLRAILEKNIEFRFKYLDSRNWEFHKDSDDVIHFS